MNPDKQKDEIKALKEALDISSKYNRNLWGLFLALEFYILIVVFATTDYMLLVPDSKVKLPLLNIDLELFTFFITAPLVLIGFHFYLLFNLKHHTEKLFTWAEITNTSEKMKGFPFIFNYLVYYERGTFLFKLLNVIIYTVNFILPLFALIFMQWKFGKYHSIPMTVYHCSSVLLDTIILLILWKKIFAGSMLFETKTDADKQIAGLFSLKRYRQAFGNRFFKPDCLTNLFAGISIFISLFIIANMIAIVYFKRVGYLLPLRLDLHDQTLVKTRPVEEILSSGIFGKITSEEDELKLKYGLNLQRRDLMGANLSNTKIMVANLSDANLQEANLSGAKLQGANLSGADLQGANLPDAKLQGADLSYAKLQGADLSRADLQGANLPEAKLQGADLSIADLQGANSSRANLQKASLFHANLQEADLSDANLQGADLSGANLRKAILPEADLQEANLPDANLQGANLSNTNLQGADLFHANLQEADLSGANLQGADLSGANLQGAFAKKIFLNCAILSTTNLEGFYVIEVDCGTEEEKEEKEMSIEEEMLPEAGNKSVDEKYKNSEKIKITPNIKKFTEIRKKLSCEIPEVAIKSLTFELASKEETAIFKDEIIKYMAGTCLEKLKQTRKALENYLKKTK